MKKIIYKLINDAIEGVDVYHHNGAFWLIFPDRREWVIELNSDGKLWYNLIFFNNLFKYVSLDVIENQHYITMWVEDAIQDGVKNTDWNCYSNSNFVEDTIQNGVKNTFFLPYRSEVCIEDAMRNGVKNTFKNTGIHEYLFEETMRNGVKIN